MARLQNESGPSLDLGPARLEHGALHMGNCSAFVTHQVEGVVAREVVDSAAVAEMNVLDQTELGQRIERAIDGGLVNGGIGASDTGSEVVRRGMVIDREEGFDHGPPWFGEAASGSAQSFQDVVDGPGHAGTVHLTTLRGLVDVLDFEQLAVIHLLATGFMVARGLSLMKVDRVRALLWTARGVVALAIAWTV